MTTDEPRGLRDEELIQHKVGRPVTRAKVLQALEEVLVGFEILDLDTQTQVLEATYEALCTLAGQTENLDEQ